MFIYLFIFVGLLHDIVIEGVQQGLYNHQEDHVFRWYLL